MLNWPEEYLTSISGTVADLWQHIIIRSLSFKTNKDTKYGPYGVVTGQPFSYSAEGGVIVGFHGRSGTLLDAIGAYVKIPQKKVWSTSLYNVSQSSCRHMFYWKTKLIFG